MGRRTVTDDKHGDTHPTSYQPRDERVRGNRFVVGMRCNDQQRTRMTKIDLHNVDRRTPDATAPPTCIRCASGPGCRRYMDRSVIAAASG